MLSNFKRIKLSKFNDLGDELQVENCMQSDEKSESQENEAEKCIDDDKPVISKNKSRLLEDDEDENSLIEDMEDEPETDKNDPFSLHFEHEITDDLISNIDKNQIANLKLSWPVLGDMRVATFSDSPETLPTVPVDLNALHIKQNLLDNVEVALASYQKTKSPKERTKSPKERTKSLSAFQMELLSIMCNYPDLVFTERTFTNCEEIRLSYCLHALNHVLKTRSRIIHHNMKMSKKTNDLADYRDQGLARPKVLILVPFKESALRIVNFIIKLLMPGKKGNVLNKKRFRNEFASTDEDVPPKHSIRPQDFNATFAGNTDDSFRLGITVTRRSLRLYADFYSSDIIVASPLGLRTVIGAEGEKEHHYDFLASIEMLILDQADVFLMQNWEHVLHILQHLHLKPSKARNTDFSRVRMWTLNGWSKYYRQTLMFSSIGHPLLSAVFNRSCSNFVGRMSFMNRNAPTALSQVLLQVPQVFHRFVPSSLDALPDERFKFFVTKVLSHFKDPVMSHTLIYISSYFDFVRLRNYMKKEEMSFTQICEYSKPGKVARARDMFFHGQKHFMLFTERFHFYHRYIIKGVRHVVFYELPTYPHFYGEMVNLLHPQYQAKQREVDNSSAAIVYSKYEVQQLTGVVGLARAKDMLTSDKKVHMFVTER